MKAKIAAVSLFVLTIVGTAQADDGSAGSSDSFRQVCDEAMPDLLRGDPKGFDTLKSAVPPEGVAFLEGLSFQFRGGFEPSRKDRGEPVDWQLLGVKRVGTTVRQYVYLCRYAKQPMFWCFTAQERNGRWWLTALHFESKLPRASIGNGSKDPACGKICDEILGLFSQESDQAAEALKKHFPTMDESGRDWAVRGLLQEISKNGRLVKCELADVRAIGSSVAEYCYAVQWQRGMKFFFFTFYRPAKDWKMINFAFNGDFAALLAQAPLEADAPSIPLQAARPAASARPQTKTLPR